ncbi:3-isopropylmalate dehydrogenase [Sphingosinicella ginsenosidimutans]|uniref:3-isopropylmalate dehydrogenase n=1 Tax=Allosphingosinicella ginsenosidimutans TaxID=1176539 RepID=A0A5C6TWA9_9SPHN|nr:3-isopropylmalate dehydrogenase [Sphingosinicella ginsenosidimutans]TXC64155.1 3-isopropylmalate dehydrogenase [Sphingosinicella ginsenosidimutans]
MTRIVLLPGDGIGPEVTEQARLCLAYLSERRELNLSFETHDFGGAAIDRHGEPLPEATLAACRAADGILLGAVGGPDWDDAPARPEAGLLGLRAALGLFANLRPARVIAGLEHLSPIRGDLVRGADILIVRELTGGAYFGTKTIDAERASDEFAYTREEIERVAHVAFAAARRRANRLTLVDKANVLATSRLWRQVVGEIALGYPEVAVEYVYVDAAAMALITNPRRFDVILTENMFGDILSDELAVIPGSIGLLASASTGTERAALFEPIHGSAPEIAGMDVANPAGAIASAAMLLDHVGQSEMAFLLRGALDDVLSSGTLTADLGGGASCSEFGEAVRTRIDARLCRVDAVRSLVGVNRGMTA